MLFEHSEEGDTPGLGIFPGDVVRFASDRVDQTGARLKVPQMGWNQVTQTREHPMWNGITNGAWFYFVHSYYAKPTEADLTVGTTARKSPWLSPATTFLQRSSILKKALQPV